MISEPECIGVGKRDVLKEDVRAKVLRLIELVSCRNSNCTRDVWMVYLDGCGHMSTLVGIFSQYLQTP